MLQMCVCISEYILVKVFFIFLVLLKHVNTAISIIILEKEMATHSSILAWKIPWTEEFGGLQSMRLQRVGHD